ESRSGNRRSWIEGIGELQLRGLHLLDGQLRISHHGRPGGAPLALGEGQGAVEVRRLGLPELVTCREKDFLELPRSVWLGHDAPVLDRAKPIEQVRRAGSTVTCRSAPRWPRGA